MNKEFSNRLQLYCVKVSLKRLLRDAKDFDDLFFGLSEIVEELEE